MISFKKLLLICLISLWMGALPFSLFSQNPLRSEGTGPLRSFDELFPGLDEDSLTQVFSLGGLIFSRGKDEALELTPASNSGFTLKSDIMRNNPTYLTESLLVLPYQGRNLNRLDAYNALGKIRDLAGRLYHSFTRNEEVPLFEEATRLQGDRRTGGIPDPPPASELPATDTVYIRLRDINFGNSYYRAEFTLNPHGVTYNITNNRNLTYLFFTVMREERFNAILYIEPIRE